MITENRSTPPPADPPRADARRHRRASIEHEAARLFARDGFQATTMDGIAAAVGVSKPILYRHFESKREIFAKVLERRRDELAATPLDRFLHVHGGVAERLHAMTDAWFAHVQQHPHSSRMLFEDVSGDVQLVALQRELRARQRAADVALMRELAPGLPEIELEPLGEIIRSSLTGLALWWLDRPDVPREVPVAAILRMTLGLLASARARAGGSASV